MGLGAISLVLVLARRFGRFHGGNSPAQAHQNSGEAHELNRKPLNISIEMSDTRPCNTPATE
jgi:hypothetical protein